MTRSDKVPKDNLDLEQLLEVAIAKSNGGYGKFTRGKCLSMVTNAPAGMEGLSPPVSVAASHEKYVAAVKQLRVDADAYITRIDGIEKYKDDDERVARLAANYHYAEGESVDTYAYDKFLRCIIPNLLTVKDEQGVLEALAPALTDPVPNVTRWRKDCYATIRKTEGLTADPDYKNKVEAFSKDDRDVQALKDILKADFDKERRAAHDPFSKAWFAFSSARSEHLSAVGAVLAD